MRDVNFNYNGRNFISGGYDKTVNYWDTETGKIITEIKLKAFPKSIKIHPNEANEHSFLLGSSNKKVFNNFLIKYIKNLMITKLYLKKIM